MVIGDVWRTRLKFYLNGLSLRGISSLAVVPVNYFLLDLVVILGITGLDFFRFCIVGIAVLTTSFLLACSVENLSNMIRKIKKQRVVWFGLVAMFLLASSVTLICNRDTSLVILTRTFGQIVLCLLLVVRWL